MRSNIQKWGNSHAVRLPKALLSIAQIQENDAVVIHAEPNMIIIKKTNSIPHVRLRDRLTSSTSEYIHEELDSGQPIGNEVL